MIKVPCHQMYRYMYLLSTLATIKVPIQLKYVKITANKPTMDSNIICKFRKELLDSLRKFLQQTSINLPFAFN